MWDAFKYFQVVFYVYSRQLIEHWDGIGKHSMHQYRHPARVYVTIHVPFLESAEEKIKLERIFTKQIL